MTATITRYRLLARSSRYPWYWGYRVELNGQRHAFGRYPLASIRRWCREHGATSIVETWTAVP